MRKHVGSVLSLMDELRATTVTLDLGFQGVDKYDVSNLGALQRELAAMAKSINPKLVEAK